MLECNVQTHDWRELKNRWKAQVEYPDFLIRYHFAVCRDMIGGPWSTKSTARSRLLLGAHFLFTQRIIKSFLGGYQTEISYRRRRQVPKPSTPKKQIPGKYFD